MASDSELLERLRSGSRDAFDTVFREWYPRLVAVAQSVVGERATAEEVAQEVMLEVWRRRETLRLETTLAAYLVRSARNRALNQVRHERVVRRSEPLLLHESPASSPARADAALREQELGERVGAAVESLPARCREVFELSRVQGLKYTEIAAAMGISVKTVEAQMGRALRLLRERLQDVLED